MKILSWSQSMDSYKSTMPLSVSWCLISMGGAPLKHTLETRQVCHQTSLQTRNQEALGLDPTLLDGFSGPAGIRWCWALSHHQYLNNLKLLQRPGPHLVPRPDLEYSRCRCNVTWRVLFSIPRLPPLVVYILHPIHTCHWEKPEYMNLCLISVLLYLLFPLPRVCFFLLLSFQQVANFSLD